MPICWAAVPLLVFAADVPPADRHADADLRRDQIAYLTQTKQASNAKQLYSKLHERQLGLARRVSAREAAGEDATCSRQILSETMWLNGDTLDFARIERRLDDLESVLAHPAEESKARDQDPADGSWGRCHQEWFFRVNATFDHLSGTKKPRYELSLLDRVNSPQKLRQYFESVSVSDVASTGRDNRRELNESIENLGRMILEDRPAYYRWDPALKPVLMEIILNRLRNPDTGWWGARFLRNGRIEFVDSLSMTYHMVTTLDGKAPDFGKAMDHLLAVKELEYPIGWLHNGRYSNHHNMDVVTLFAYGWPHMTGVQKQAAALQIRKMVDWCVTESLQPDGSFKTGATDDSLEEETNYGASFLARAGLFDPSKRFWTKEQISAADEIRTRIVAFIRGRAVNGGKYYRDALAELGAQ